MKHKVSCIHRCGTNNVTAWISKHFSPSVSVWSRVFFFFSSRRRHTRCSRDWSSDVCSYDLFDWTPPDVFVIPGGNLGNVSALGKGLLMMKDLGLITRLPRIVVAQAQRANPLYRSYLKNFESFEPIQAQKTLASAIQIGNPVSIQKAIRTLKQFNGIVEQATEEELANAAALGDRTGMFNCPHTGVALAVLIKLLKAGKIDKSERVVVISTAHGLKFVEMKVKYHKQELEFPSRHANQPIELPARLDEIKSALHKALESRKQFEL